MATTEVKTRFTSTQREQTGYEYHEIVKHLFILT